ncbi:cupin-like domain-containing protein [Rheinheimera sp.]|uniref:cupin-like domain-containing protein n=1 Tax=Rheinheimera sp. TaxID=1869214 RepID=UPI00307F0888
MSASPEVVAVRQVQCDPGQVPVDLLDGQGPVLIKGLLSHWPLLQAGKHSAASVADYLLTHYNGRTTQVYYGEPGLNGRYFYNDDYTALNFEARIGRVDDVLQQLLQWQQDPQPPSLYIASNLIQSHFPLLLQQNQLDWPKPALPFSTEPERISLWLGNRSLAACHYDSSDNLACVIAGKRRFTLFPPEQIANLYPGPLEPTPGGQVISLVDFANPDLQKFPNFAKAQAVAQVVELEPGDALYLPAMWWHQVEALESFNLLLNYWWSEAPRYTGAGSTLLYHALLTLKDKPAHERRAWRALLDYYIFEPEQSVAHLPDAAQGLLGGLDEQKARQLRAMLLQRLNR